MNEVTNARTSAACRSTDSKRRGAHDVHWQSFDVDTEAHARLNGHRSGVVWFTGLSGAGKSTVANAVQRRLHAAGVHTALLDGDNVRHGLNQDLGFSDEDRVENIRRVAEVARLMADAGLIVLVSLVSPFQAERAMARELAGEGRFCEVFVDTEPKVAEGRDAKGLYAKARTGELPKFTGIDSPYEAPQNPELHLRTRDATPDVAADRVMAVLRDLSLVN